MYKCSGCGGYIEELGDMASDNPCHCAMDTVKSKLTLYREAFEAADELVAVACDNANEFFPYVPDYFKDKWGHYEDIENMNKLYSVYLAAKKKLEGVK